MKIPLTLRVLIRVHEQGVINKKENDFLEAYRKLYPKSLVIFRRRAQSYYRIKQAEYLSGPRKPLP